MSIYALGWAKQQRTGSAAMKALLMMLADYADEMGSCWPSQERLADETEQSVRTVRTQLHKLAEMGLLRVQVGSGSSNGGRKTNRYFLNLDNAANLAGKSTPPSTGVTGKSVGGLPANPSGGYRQLVAGEPSVEPPVEPPVEEKADRSAPAALFVVEAPLTEHQQKPAGKAPDPVNVAAKQLADQWHQAKNGMANFHAVRTVVRTALLAGHTVDQVSGAMLKLHHENVPLTNSTLAIELRGGIGSGRTTANSGGYKPYRDEDYWGTEEK